MLSFKSSTHAFLDRFWGKAQQQKTEAARVDSASAKPSSPGRSEPASKLRTRNMFGSLHTDWGSLWENAPVERQPCIDANHWDTAKTFGAIAVELRVWQPLIDSLNLSHRVLPRTWHFHIFHANFTTNPESKRWFLHGAMAKAIDEWRHAGRRVSIHAYPDQWHLVSAKHKTRPSNTYPRMRKFWTDYFHEDKIITLQSDTGFCLNSRRKISTFTGVDWIGATWGSTIFGKGNVGQGGLSWRNRRAMYNCIDWLSDGTQHQNKRSVLWDWGWMRNEDAMMVQCMRGKKGDGKIEHWNGSHSGKRLHYHVASHCLADQFSQEMTAIDAVLKGQPPPLGLHSICRSITTYGQCEEVDDAAPGRWRGPERPGDPPVIGAFRCAREGFSIDRAFDAWTAFCGPDLNYMRFCTDYVNTSSAAGPALMFAPTSKRSRSGLPPTARPHPHAHPAILHPRGSGSNVTRARETQRKP